MCVIPSYNISNCTIYGVPVEAKGQVNHSGKLMVKIGNEKCPVN